MQEGLCGSIFGLIYSMHAMGFGHGRWGGSRRSIEGSVSHPIEPVLAQSHDVVNISGLPCCVRCAMEF